MRALVRILLGPILLWQGARVRRTILRLPEATGPRQGGADGLRVLILGDSSAAGVGVETQDAALSGRLAAALAPISVQWQVLATTGWTTADGLAALDRLGDARFDAAILCLGVNDITTETGLVRWLEIYSQVLGRLAGRHGVARVYLCGLPPMGRFPALPQPLRWFMGLQADAHDRALAHLASRRAWTRHLPVESDLPASAAAVDGFHPGPLVYAELGERFAAAIREDLVAGHFAAGPRDILTPTGDRPAPKPTAAAPTAVR